MSKKYKHSNEEFIIAVNSSSNICETLKKLGLAFRGASYVIFKKRCEDLGINLEHFNPDKKLREAVTQEELLNSIKLSRSRHECLKELNLRPDSRGNLTWLKTFVASKQIDISHWPKEKHNLGRKFGPSPFKKSSEQLLVEESNINTKQKKRLLKEGILQDICYECGISEWRNKTLSLHLDHINGCHTDNRIDNLRMLCPNCHSQTDTYCKKKTSTSRSSRT